MAATFSICKLSAPGERVLLGLGSFRVESAESVPASDGDHHVSFALFDASCDEEAVVFSPHDGLYVRCQIENGLHTTVSPPVSLNALDAPVRVSVAGWPGWRTGRLEAAVDRVGAILDEMLEMSS